MACGIISSVNPNLIISPIGTIPSIIDTFLELLDTPNSYSAQASKLVRVRSDELALEFQAESIVTLQIAYNNSPIIGGFARIDQIIGKSIGILTEVNNFLKLGISGFEVLGNANNKVGDLTDDFTGVSNSANATFSKLDHNQLTLRRLFGGSLFDVAIIPSNGLPEGVITGSTGNIAVDVTTGRLYSKLTGSVLVPLVTGWTEMIDAGSIQSVIGEKTFVNSALIVKASSTASNSIFRIITPNTTGVAAPASHAEIDLYDGTSLGGKFICAFGNIGSRFIGIISQSDRDGVKLPIQFFTSNSAGGDVSSFYIQAGQAPGVQPNVGIGGSGVANTFFVPEGVLDVRSTTGALIVPRMTTIQRDALPLVNGSIVYNTTTNKFNGLESGIWVNLI